LHAYKSTSVDVKARAWESSVPLKKSKPDPRLPEPVHLPAVPTAVLDNGAPLGPASTVAVLPLRGPLSRDTSPLHLYAVQQSPAAAIGLALANTASLAATAALPATATAAAAAAATSTARVVHAFGTLPAFVHAEAQDTAQAAAEEEVAAAAAAAAMTAATETEFGPSDHPMVATTQTAMTTAAGADSDTAEGADTTLATGKRRRSGGRPATPLKSEVTIVVDMNGSRIGYTCNACGVTLRDRQVNGSRIAAHLFSCKRTSLAIKSMAWERSEPLRKSKPDPRPSHTDPSPLDVSDLPFSHEDRHTPMTSAAAVDNALLAASHVGAHAQPQSHDTAKVFSIGVPAEVPLSEALIVEPVQCSHALPGTLSADAPPASLMSLPNNVGQLPAAREQGVGEKRKRVGGRAATPMKSEVTVVWNEAGCPTGYTCNACQTCLRDRQLNGSRIAAHLYGCKETSVDVKTRAWLSSTPLKKSKPDPRLSELLPASDRETATFDADKACIEISFAGHVDAGMTGHGVVDGDSCLADIDVEAAPPSTTVASVPAAAEHHSPHALDMYVK
jgi:hypothetical protein